MKISNTSIATLGLLLLGSALTATSHAQIPDHPAEIVFPELSFEPPLGAEYRHELSSGVPVYVVPSHEFPLVTLSFTFKGGEYLVPDEHVGMASALGNQMRRGGTTHVKPDDLDERLDFLAANVSTSVGGETSSASVDCLKQNFDEALGLLMDVVQNPGFDEEKLRIYKDQVLEGFEQRNDNPMGVAMSNLRRLAYGDAHYSSREAPVPSLRPPLCSAEFSSSWESS
jgi:zinc protease